MSWTECGSNNTRAGVADYDARWSANNIRSRHRDGGRVAHLCLGLSVAVGALNDGRFTWRCFEAGEQSVCDMPTLRQMSIMLQVVITLGWSMLLALEFLDDQFLDDHLTKRWIIGTAVLIVMAIAALAFWWRWEQE